MGRPRVLRPQLRRDSLGAVHSMDTSSYRSNSLSPDEWALVWLRHQSERQDEDFWAWDELTWTVVDNPERAWPVILALAEQATLDQLGAIGAGPIEHLVENHAAAFIDRIETEAERNAQFRKALAAIWLNTWNQDPALVSRLVAASGGVIEAFHLDHNKTERDEEHGGTAPN